MIWGRVKSYHRKTCTYNYADLKRRLPDTLLHELPIAFVRRAARYYFRFMDGYRQGLDGPLLDFSMKKYSSHRTIPLGVIKSLESVGYLTNILTDAVSISSYTFLYSYENPSAIFDII